MSVLEEILQSVIRNQHIICNRIVAQGGILSPQVNSNNREWHSQKIPKNQNAYQCLFNKGSLPLISQFSQCQDLCMIDLACGVPYYWSEILKQFKVHKIIGLDLFQRDEIYDLCCFSEKEKVRVSYQQVDLLDQEQCNRFLTTTLKENRTLNFVFSHVTLSHLMSCKQLLPYLDKVFLFVPWTGNFITKVRNRNNVLVPEDMNCVRYLGDQGD